MVAALVAWQAPTEAARDFKLYPHIAIIRAFPVLDPRKLAYLKLIWCAVAVSRISKNAPADDKSFIWADPLCGQRP
jgi:hypothetical protein